MTPSARVQTAIDLLGEILASTRPADGVVAFFFRNRRYIGAKDRRAVADRVYGVLRRRARLGWWLERSGHPADARAMVLADLAIGEQLSPEAAAELCDGHVNAPALLSRGERQLVGRLQGQPLFHHEMPDWVRGEFPSWLEAELSARFGGELGREMGALRDEAPVDLRVNTLKGGREQALAVLAAEGLVARPTPWSPWGLRLTGRVALMASQGYRDGLVEVQDEGSQLVALLTDARPGQAVLDYCAGAGGKTLALAARMENRGRLVACDTHENRIGQAQERLRRAGVHNVTRRLLDAEAAKWLKRNAGSFDRVLVDAPCSGTGTWRRNPDAKWKLSPTDLSELTALQGGILAAAARMVRPGGRLIYATCSLLPAENERILDQFIAAHDDFAALPAATVWGEVVGSEGPAGQEGPWLRLTPARHGTDGFFVGIVERRDERRFQSDAGPAAAEQTGDDRDDEEH